MHLRSDSCDACRVLLSEIFCCRSFASIFTDKRDTHVLLERQAIALLYVDVRIITSLLSHNESEPLLHIEILSCCKLGRLQLVSKDGKEVSYLDGTKFASFVGQDGLRNTLLLSNLLGRIALVCVFQDE